MLKIKGIALVVHSLCFSVTFVVTQLLTNNTVLAVAVATCKPVLSTTSYFLRKNAWRQVALRQKQHHQLRA
jgi:uncharacterized membrane protein